MGMNILGRPETVKSFKRSDFIKFCRRHIDTTRVVFSCVGDISQSHVERVCEKHFRVKKKKALNGRKRFSNYRGHQVELKRPVKQARCAIGREAYSIHHPNRIPFYMLVNLLGGPGMNSKLNMSLRERHGYVYSVEAMYSSYSDTGIFSVMFGTEPRQLDRCLHMIRREFDKLTEKPMGKRQLKLLQEQIKGQMALAEESGLSLMLMMGRSLLDLNRVPTQEEVFEKVQQVDAIKLQNVAQEMFDEKTISVLRMVPNGKITVQ
jgi:predicted Zn-dependent peptidase